MLQFYTHTGKKDKGEVAVAPFSSCFPEKTLLERAGELELFLQAVKGDRNNTFLNGGDFPSAEGFVRYHGAGAI